MPIHDHINDPWALFETSVLGTGVVDSRGQIVWANPALAEMFGFGRDELHQQPIELLLPGQSSMVMSALGPEHAGRGRLCELRGRRQDGGTFLLEIALSAAESAGGAWVMLQVLAIRERLAPRQPALAALAAPAFAEDTLDVAQLVDITARWIGEAIGGWCAIRLLAGDDAGNRRPTASFRQAILLSPETGELANSSEHAHLAAEAERFGAYSAIGVPLRVQRRLIGTLTALRDETAAPYTEEDLLLVQELADRAALAIHHAQLFEQVRVGRERLQSLSSQLVQAQEDERRRLARELHDEIGQSLTAVHLNLQILMSAPDHTAEPHRLEDSTALIELVLQQVRALSLDLRPSLLDDLGLAPALRWLLKRQSERAGFVAQLVAEADAERYTPALETTCYRVVQEALTNIARYAQAREVMVTLERRDALLHLMIRDDGVGFDVAAARQRAEQGQSLGMLSMRERIEIAGGHLAIESTAGHGTTIEAWLPLELAAPGQAIERRRWPR